MRRCVAAMLALVLVVSGCGKKGSDASSAAPKTLKVLCGGGIRPAMEAVKAEFEKANDCTVTVNYAGSGTLFGQLQAGAPADLYLPGDIWYIHKAAEKGLVDSHRAVAWFVPVIGVQKGNPKGVTKLQDLIPEDLKVGLGKAAACAVGNTARDVLAAADLKDKVKPDFEALTVNRLANQIKLKALDAAIIWDATAKQYPQDIEAVPVEDGNFHAVAMAIGVLKQAKNLKLARQFADFAAGKVGAKCFRDNHYNVPGQKLMIGCGSSMRLVLEDLSKLFTETTGRETMRHFGGSGTVLLQIQESKEGDIYLCHDPYAYITEKRGISERWHTAAYIQPTIAVLKGNPKNVKGLKDLVREDLKLGLPHRSRSTRGQILWAMFKKAGILEKMEKKKFFESRTHDLVNQLKLNAVDVAVLWDAPVKVMPEFEAIPMEKEYKVDAVTSATSGKVHSLERVKITLVRLKMSKEPLLAAQFVKLCLSDAGKEIWKKHRFSLP